MSTEITDSREQEAQRKAKLAKLRQSGQAYPNDFRRTAYAANLLQEYAHFDNTLLSEKAVEVKLAGRMMTRRVMGKASFAHIQDMTGKIQLYITRDSLPAGQYDAFLQFDLGDIIGCVGQLFKTKTGELSVKVSNLRLLAKALHPLPDKYHGLHDHEQRFRQRYLDLIVNEQTRRVFRIRSRLVAAMRQFFNARDYIEVETPMMQIQAGGAAAKPFMTHHNALDMPLYLRIAPELYLKRLVVGGFERVYEINRNFRNEGISTRHNPEFTMLEFYQAYATYIDMMDFTEEMFRYLAQKVLGQTTLHYQGTQIDLTQPFERMTMLESICLYEPKMTQEQLLNKDQAKQLAVAHGISVYPSMGLGAIQTALFETLVEPRLLRPTFITAYPIEVSPLARRNDNAEVIADRFEFFVGGQEIANGFSELNDPEDQANRFIQQLAAREAGDEEAMSYDEDYVTALEYGMPPTAGEGIGIDRLTMLFTDSASIREVILFPLMRPKRQTRSESPQSPSEEQS